MRSLRGSGDEEWTEYKIRDPGLSTTGEEGVIQWADRIQH